MPFLRFDNVKFDILFSWSESQSIGGTISSLGNTYDAFKTSKMVVGATVDRTCRESFPNHTTILDYISMQLIPTPIFDSFQSCKFAVTFLTDSESATDFVASLLQLPAIVRKSKILIKLRVLEINHQQRMHMFRRLITIPIDAIANWLYRTAEGTQSERALSIDLSPDRIENTREIFNHLKEVNFYANFYSSFYVLVTRFK